jgi:chromosome segregation ATPase
MVGAGTVLLVSISFAAADDQKSVTAIGFVFFGAVLVGLFKLVFEANSASAAIRETTKGLDAQVRGGSRATQQLSVAAEASKDLADDFAAGLVDTRDDLAGANKSIDILRAELAGVREELDDHSTRIDEIPALRDSVEDLGQATERLTAIVGDDRLDDLRREVTRLAECVTQWEPQIPSEALTRSTSI